MAIDDDTRYVGLNTTTPAAPLDVNGLNYSGSSTDGNANFGSSAGYHLTVDDNEVQSKVGVNGFGPLFLNYWEGILILDIMEPPILPKMEMSISPTMP
ncbi:MAG: hypothetical protein HWD58_10500 [Bacteroidota bacterium]|nr:MAG: hypothetical protein HWD58_10500 [Bacteroidota bacterium]